MLALVNGSLFNILALFEPLSKKRKVSSENEEETPDTSDETAAVKKKGKNKGKNIFLK